MVTGYGEGVVEGNLKETLTIAESTLSISRKAFRYITGRKNRNLSF